MIDKKIAKSISKILPLGIDEDLPFLEHLDSKHKIGIKNSEIVLLFLGRIDPKKGLQELLSGMQIIPDSLLEKNNIRLIVIGTGKQAYVNKLQKIAIDLNDKIKIDWIGPLWDSRKWTYFAAADLFCFPSFSENFGYSALEAAYMGTPILASVYTPWANVSYGDFSIPIKPNDISIQQGIIKFLNEFDYWQNTRISRHKWVIQNFSWRNISVKYKRFYNTIINEYIEP